MDKLKQKLLNQTPPTQTKEMEEEIQEKESLDPSQSQSRKKNQPSQKRMTNLNPILMEKVRNHPMMNRASPRVMTEKKKTLGKILALKIVMKRLKKMNQLKQ